MAETGYRAPPNSGFSNTFSTYVTLIGFSAGNSDFWRFPFLVYRNGGGAFLIPFLFTTFISGIPLFYLEYTFSNFAGKGPYKIWDISPLFRGIGITIFTTSTIFSTTSTLFRGWLMYFFVNSFTSPLPWTHCNNTWNTDSCLENPFIDNINNARYLNVSMSEKNQSLMTYNQRDKENITKMTAAEEFWQYETLRLSSGLTDFGEFNWRMLICIVVFRILVFFSMIKSIKSIEKVMYVTTFAQFGFILIVFIRSLMLPGAAAGLSRFFLTDLSKLGEIRIWVEAFLMSFYTMSIGWGSVITMGSHAKFKDNSLRTCILTPTVDAFIAIMTGVVCFTVLGNMAHVYRVHVDEVVNAGVSLGMVSYVTALSALPLPNLWSAGFILSVILTGLDSQVIIVETSIQILGETFPNIYPRYRLTTLVLFSLGLVVLALPTATGLILITSVAKYVPPKYGSYNYPDGARAMGWLMVTCVIAPIPIIALRDLFKASGTFTQKFRLAIKSNERWRPKEDTVMEDFKTKEAKFQTRTLAEVAYFAIFGQYRGRAEPVLVTEMSNIR